ncbi:lysophospholipid acyltransferase family protein [Candidatus Dependentiae bacterium]
MSNTSILKKITIKLKNSIIFTFLVQNIIYCYLRILFSTYRLTIKMDYDFEKDFKTNKGVFYFWHQNIIAATCFFFSKKCIGHCVVSSSRDGKIMGSIAQKLGFKVLYGSAYKRSINLIKHALDVLDANKRLAIVGDGSRGPAFKLKRGPIYLAAKSQLPLVFLEVKTEWAFTFKKSWDKFQIPLPFSKIFIRVHSPVMPSPDAYKKN